MRLYPFRNPDEAALPVLMDILHRLQASAPGLTGALNAALPR